MTGLHWFLVGLVGAFAVGIIVQIIRANREIRRFTWDEPMPWEHSDYHPPARMRVQADFIEKE